MATSGHGLESDSGYPLALLGAYAVVWLWLALAPSFRADWLLENLLVFIAVPMLACSHRRLRLSNRAYTLLFAFLVLHAIGAHYTYAEVPYDRWAEALTGHSLNEMAGLHRNHYDRLVHFMYGLLVTPAAIQVLDARTPQRGAWRWLVPFTFMLSHSVVFELIEWMAAEIFGGELGQAYLGTQGDGWDAQKDMALAALGAAIAVSACRWRHMPGGLDRRLGRGRHAAFDQSQHSPLD